MFILSLSVSFAGESGSLKWKSFSDGVNEARRSDKKLLIDVYTDWCGWCKRMDSETYANKDISDYLGKKFVVIKLNAESGKKVTYQGKDYTEQELAAAFGITGYPATLFLKSDGQPITIYPGFADAAKFKDVLTFIGEDHYLTKQFQDYSSNKD